MEKNSELEGSYTTEYRQLDSRIGRWTSVDPAANLYYSWSPYNLSMNSPLANSDPSGATVTPPVAGSVEEQHLNTALNDPEFKKQYDILVKSKNVYTYKFMDIDPKSPGTGGGQIKSLGKNSQGTLNLEIQYGIPEYNNFDGYPVLFTLYEETYHSADYESGNPYLNFAWSSNLNVRTPNNISKSIYDKHKKANPNLSQPDLVKKVKPIVEKLRMNAQIKAEVDAKMFAILNSGKIQTSMKLNAGLATKYNKVANGKYVFTAGDIVQLVNPLASQIKTLGNTKKAMSLLENAMFHSSYQSESTYTYTKNGVSTKLNFKFSLIPPYK